MHGELDVARLEPGDEADRDEVVAHRVDERAAELAVARERAERPAHRVHDLRSGRGTRQTSFTPSAQICGFAPSSPKCSTAALVSRPCVPSASTVTPAVTSEPGSKVGSCSPLATTAPVAGARADDPPVLDEQLRRGGLRQHGDAERLRLLAEEATELRDGEDHVPVVPHRRRRRDAERRAAREDVDGLARAPRRRSGCPRASAGP